MLQLRPTFSESWYRVVTLKPRLRANAQISRQFYRGDRWYVVRDPAGNQFHRLSDAAYRFVGLLDGTRTVGDAWDLVGGQLADDAPTQPEVIQILSQLYSANLVETDITPDSQVLLRRHKKQQQRKMQGRLMNMLFPRIPIWDPDRFVCRWMPLAKVLLSKVGALIWLTMVIIAIAVLAPRWEQLKESASHATDPKNWFFLWVTFCLIKFIHELGHAFTCRRFGGEVHEMGIMFLVFVPTPYVDASTAWAFPNKWARMFVGAGGMWIELFVASICALIWASTGSGNLVNELAFNTMLIASVTTVVFNANPLLRYDGYYILSDWLEIPNLQQKSREYCMGLIKRHVFRIRATQPLPPPVQRVQLFIYGVLSSIYRAIVGVTIIFVVMYKVAIIGALMALGGVITWLLTPLVKLFRYLTIEPELHRKRGRAWAFSLAVISLAVILIGLIRFPNNVDGEGIVEPHNREVLNAVTPGFVREVKFKDGDAVHKGDVIAVLNDADIDGRAKQLDAQVEGAQIELKQAIGNFDQNSRRAIEGKIEALRSERADVQRQLDEQVIKAPFDGRLVSPHILDRIGSYLHQGESLGSVATIDELAIYATITQRDAALLQAAVAASRGGSPTTGPATEPGSGDRLAAAGAATTPALATSWTTEIRLVGDLDQVLHATQADLVPAAQRQVRDASLTIAGGGDNQNDPRDPSGKGVQNPEFELRVRLSNPDLRYTPGQRAYVRVKLDRTPLSVQWYRKFLQLLQAHRQEASPLVQ